MERGLTVSTLADLSGISRYTIYKWEAGTALPSFASIEILAQVFNLPPNYFFTEKKEPIVVDAARIDQLSSRLEKLEKLLGSQQDE